MIKYPRTYHLPYSPCFTSDDKRLDSDSLFKDKQVVVTLKMDGENTSLYNNGLHARSLDLNPHPSRNWIIQFHKAIKEDIPQGWRICGENLTAVHSIKYKDLKSRFLIFSIWDDKNQCLSWDHTEEWAKLLDLETVPVIYSGLYDKELILDSYKSYQVEHEGFVVRLQSGFEYKNFAKSLAKYVRPNHIQTDEH